jgi:hypothetical protein
LFIDGGRSFREFWILGGEIADRLHAIERTLRAAVETAQDPQNPESVIYLKSKRACVRLAVGAGRGFPNSTTADRLTIEVPIRNEGETTAYDVVLTVYSLDEASTPVGAATLHLLEPGQNARLAFTLPRPRMTDPPPREDRWYRFHFSYRDALGKDEASFVVHFTGILGADYRGEVATERGIVSSLCPAAL